MVTRLARAVYFQFRLQRQRPRGAAGGIYDSGALTLTNSVLQNDTAQGGAGTNAASPRLTFGGGGGGSAAGAIYVTAGATLDLAASDRFSNDSATGGAGGSGGTGFRRRGRVLRAAQAARVEFRPSMAAQVRRARPAAERMPEARWRRRPVRIGRKHARRTTLGAGGGGGGGGNAFADVGGKGTITGP